VLLLVLAQQLDERVQLITHGQNVSISSAFVSQSRARDGCSNA